MGLENKKIDDKLLNTLQLSESLSGTASDLVKASLVQRSTELSRYNFGETITWGKQKRLALYFSLPVTIILFITLFQPQFLTSPSERLINFNKEYFPPAPFEFGIDQLPSYAFRNEDLEIILPFQGDMIPESSFIWVGGDKRQMVKASPGQFKTTLRRVQSDLSLRFEAEGFFSTKKVIPVYDRPIASELSVVANFPKYTGWSDKTFSSVGTFKVPVGTSINWNLHTKYTDSVIVLMDSGGAITPLSQEREMAKFGHTFLVSNQLEFILKTKLEEIRSPLGP